MKRFFPLLGLLFLPLGLIAKATPPPPTQVEITPAIISKFGFKFDCARRKNSSYAALTYPSKIDNLYPRLAEVEMVNSFGELLSQTTIPVDAASRAIRYSFDNDRVAVSMAVTYCNRKGGECKNYRVSSASKVCAK